MNIEIFNEMNFQRNVQKHHTIAEELMTKCSSFRLWYGDRDRNHAIFVYPKETELINCWDMHNVQDILKQIS